MKKRILFCALVGSLFSVCAHADLYLGVKTGSMLVGFDNVEVSEDPANVAATIGYEFGSFPRISLEAEVSRTITAGLVSGNELEVESQGAYITYTTAGRLYSKWRVGYMDAALSAGVDLSEDEGGETYGVALGLRMIGFKLELDYTAVDDDVSFVSLGIRI